MAETWFSVGCYHKSETHFPFCSIHLKSWINEFNLRFWFGLVWFIVPVCSTDFRLMQNGGNQCVTQLSAFSSLKWNPNKIEVHLEFFSSSLFFPFLYVNCVFFSSSFQMIRWLAENLVISIQSILQDIVQSNFSKQEKRNAVTTILNLKSVKEKKTPHPVETSFHAYKILFLYIISKVKLKQKKICNYFILK